MRKDSVQVTPNKNLKKKLRRKYLNKATKKLKKYMSRYPYVIFVDGSASGKSKFATASAIIFRYGEVIDKAAVEVAHATSNQAEYLALILGMWLVRKNNIEEKCIFYSDSRLVVNQVTGVYKINSRYLKDLFEIVKLLLKGNWKIK